MPSLDEVRSALTNPNISSFPQEQQAQATRQLSPNPGANLSLAASDPASSQGQFGSAAGNSDYAAKFGTALQSLLKQYQQLGTKPFQQQALNASDAQTNASTAALTNPANQGYNPSTIMNAGSAAAKPFNPIIQGAQDSAQTFGEQIKSFGDVLKSSQDLLDKQAQTKKDTQNEAQQLVHEAIAAGSDAISSLAKTQPDIIKLAGYDANTITGFVTALQKQETKKTSSTTTPSGYTPTEKKTAARAGIPEGSALDYFLNTPPAFQDVWIRSIAPSLASNPNQTFSVEDVSRNYQSWFKSTQKTTSNPFAK